MFLQVSEDQKSTATGVQLLLLSTLIQLYCNPEEESVKQAVEVISIHGQNT